MVDAAGDQITYSYDADGRETGETWETIYGSDIGITNVKTFTFDAVGNLLTAEDYSGAYTFTYNDDNLVSTVQEPFGLVLTFTYDEVGNRIGVQDSLGGVQTSTYDDDNNLLTREETGEGGALLVSYTYADGQTATITDYSDLAGTEPVAKTVDSYDSDGRMIEQVQYSGGNSASGTAFLTTLYAYNDANELASETDNGVTQAYGYDAGGELLGNGTTTYTYDANGNRDGVGTGYSSSSGSGLVATSSSAGYVVGPANQVTNDGVWTYTYDTRYDLVGKNDAAGVSWTFDYNVGNELVSATETTPGSATVTVDYTYDVFDDLTGRTTISTPDTGGSGSGSGVVTSDVVLAYDNWKTNLDAQENSPSFVGQENADAWAVFAATSGGSGSAFSYDGSAYGLQSRQVFGNAVNSISAQINPVEEGPTGVNFFVTDYQGSVRAVLDNTGTLTNQISYNGFGISTQTNPAPGLSYGYEGAFQDPLVGIDNRNARWLYVSTGTFMSQDPTGMKGSGTNLTLYVKNEFTDASDPSGKEEKPSIEIDYTANSPRIKGQPVWEGIRGLKFGDRVDIKQLVIDAPIPAWLGESGSGSLSAEPREAVHTYANQTAYEEAYKAALERQRKGMLELATKSAEQAANFSKESSTAKVFRETNPLSSAAHLYKEIADQLKNPNLSEEELLRNYNSLVDAHDFVRFVQDINIKEGEKDRLKARSPQEKAFDAFNEMAKGLFLTIGKLDELPDAIMHSGTIADAFFKKVAEGIVDDPENAGLTLLVNLSPGALSKISGLSELRAAGSRVLGQLGADLVLAARACVSVLSCFIKDTPLLTPSGYKPIQDFQLGDQILSADENDPECRVGVRYVEDVFQRIALIIRVHLGGKQIGLTGDHPIFVPGRGWVQAAELKAGDRVLSHDGQTIAVDRIEMDDQPQAVYNLSVTEFHTFFVGTAAWGFSVWVHNVSAWYKTVKQLMNPGSPGKANELKATLQQIAKDAEAGNAEDFKAIAEFAKDSTGAKFLKEKLGIDPTKFASRIVPNLTEVPSVRGGAFQKWFNELSPDELKIVLSDPKLKAAVEARLRSPGRFHEWLPVSRALKFKEWGITAEQIQELRTLIKDIKFKPTGEHGGELSTTFHNKIFEIADKAPDFATYKRELAKLADQYLVGGSASLPAGLRP